MPANTYAELPGHVDPRAVIQAEKRPWSVPVESDRQIPPVRSIECRRELCTALLIADFGVRELDSRGEDGPSSASMHVRPVLRVLGSQELRRILDRPKLARKGDIHHADETAGLEELDKVAQLALVRPATPSRRSPFFQWARSVCTTSRVENSMTCVCNERNGAGSRCVGNLLVVHQQPVRTRLGLDRGGLSALN